MRFGCRIGGPDGGLALANRVFKFRMNSARSRSAVSNRPTAAKTVGRPTCGTGSGGERAVQAQKCRRVEGKTCMTFGCCPTKRAVCQKPGRPRGYKEKLRPRVRTSPNGVVSGAVADHRLATVLTGRITRPRLVRRRLMRAMMRPAVMMQAARHFRRARHGPSAHARRHQHPAARAIHAHHEHGRGNQQADDSPERQRHSLNRKTDGRAGSISSVTKIDAGRVLSIA
jgi:hypothetical protein